MVNRPDMKEAHQIHYEGLGIEPIDYIRAIMTPEEFKAFLTGNVIKYISRHKLKNGLEDLNKAQVYLQWLIDENTEQEEEKQTFTFAWKGETPQEGVTLEKLLEELFNEMEE